HAPFFSQPAQGEIEIQFPFAANLHGISKFMKFAELALRSTLRCENDDRRETMFEDFSARIDGAGAADDDAEVVFGQAPLEARTAVFRTARAELDGAEIDRARARHDGVGSGAQFEQMPLVTLAAEGDKMAIGRRKLAIGGGGNVQKNERKRTCLMSTLCGA